MKVLRINEQMCPRCGRGMSSGFQYPDCANPPDGMTRDEAHGLLCINFADDTCGDCYRDRRRGVPSHLASA